MKKSRKAVNFILFSMIIFSLFSLYTYIITDFDISENIVSENSEDEDIKTRLLRMKKDLDNTNDFNKDIISWISWENSLYTPVAYTPDNMQKYLRKNIYNEDYIGGVPFFNSSNFDNFNGNTLIYGHNMYDGTEFGLIALLKDENIFKNMKSLVVYNKEMEKFYLYKLTMLFEIVDGEEFIRLNEFTSNRERKEYNKSLYDRSYNKLEDEKDIDFSKDFLYLQTCVNHYEDDRYVIGLQKYKTMSIDDIKKISDYGDLDER